jgi:hypothetical protein
MARWFLSYHSPDQALAKRFKAAIEHEDTDSRVFSSTSTPRACVKDDNGQALAYVMLLRGVHRMFSKSSFTQQTSR